MKGLLFVYILTTSALISVYITGFILHREIVMELEARVEYYSGYAEANKDNFYTCDKQLYKLQEAK